MKTDSLYELQDFARGLKLRSNRDKIELGIILLEIQKLFLQGQIEGLEELGTFSQFLAELHLNKRRVIQMLRNAGYALKYLDPKDYDLFDSSVLDLLRRKNKNPNDYIDDIKGGVSFSDLEKIISCIQN